MSHFSSSTNNIVQHSNSWWHVIICEITFRNTNDYSYVAHCIHKTDLANFMHMDPNNHILKGFYFSMYSPLKFTNA